jgi:hypothetical protein
VRLAAELDDAGLGRHHREPDAVGRQGDVRGGHGALDVTQSRSTPLVSDAARGGSP